ncbi:RNA methyltransferase [Acidipila sp. EB88]|uniref:TrmH family RNA methyltransferase n=1 Tax=Acidipila sp. EB88 TaxID=2305226 RepID=UPI0013150568|nr:RNA methyltransferase [Acidipila sp. EB88]
MRAALTHPPVLARKPYEPSETPLLALEGFHLVAEAMRSGLAPAALFFRSGEEAGALETLERMLAQQDPAPTEHSIAADPAELLALPPALFSSLLETDAPQPIAALVPAPCWTAAQLFTGLTPARGSSERPASPLLLVLAALQDPGNVGTLLRSAEAFGATGALLLQGTATPWSSKSLRAAAGSSLRLPLLAISHGGEAAVLLRQQGIRSFAAVPAGGIYPGTAGLHHAAALWIGNEGAGLSERDLAACDARISLPMHGPTESLNAAVAGSLLLYEAARVRHAAPRASTAASQPA